MAAEEPVFDITIIGGGPTGLYAAFCAGLRSMTTKIIDSLDYLGGQLGALYSDKFIYDVPGFPAVLARTLIGDLVRQAAQYHPVIALGERVESLVRGADGILQLQTNWDAHRSRAVLIAVGGGAFSPDRLPGEAFDHYERRGLEYFLMDPSAYKKSNVLVIGGGDAAVERALRLERVASGVTLIHRLGSLRAHEGAVARLRDSSVAIRPFHELKELHGADRIEAATLVDNRTRTEQTLPFDAVLVSLGFTSTLAPMHDWGLRIEPEGLPVTPRMETTLPGVYAAGDVVTYPGKLKLLTSGFAEAATAVNNAKAWIDPQSPVEPGNSMSIVPKQRQAARRNAVARLNAPVPPPGNDADPSTE